MPELPEAFEMVEKGPIHAVIARYIVHQLSQCAVKIEPHGSPHEVEHGYDGVFRITVNVDDLKQKGLKHWHACVARMFLRTFY